MNGGAHTTGILQHRGRLIAAFALLSPLAVGGCPPDAAEPVRADGGDASTEDAMAPTDTGPLPDVGPHSDAGSLLDADALLDAGSLLDADASASDAMSDAMSDATIDATSDAGASDVSDADAGDGPGTPTTFTQCTSSSECDDGSTCTTDRCDDGACIHVSQDLCDWPAEPGADVTNLTEIEGPVWDNDFYRDLSGAVYNPISERLWLVRNNGPSKVWAVVQDDAGDYVIDERGGERGEWEEFGDAEAIAQADFEEELTVYVLNEWGTIGEYDLSVYGEKVERNLWTIEATGGNSGPEGMTFVPDAFLAVQGFVDGSGVPYTSTQGMGGLMFVGLQNNGAIHVYDLNRGTGEAIFVGEYLTGYDETAALELDRSTGQLFIWHDADIDLLEVTRLSSTEVGGGRQLDTLVTYDAPSTTLLQTTNREGFAVAPVDECVDGTRRAWMTTDGGRTFSLLLFEDFPC